jgi:hypothetical protein
MMIMMIMVMMTNHNVSTRPLLLLFDAYDEMSMAANYNPQDDDYAMSSSFADEQDQDVQVQGVFEAPASTTKNKVLEEATRQVSSYNNNNNYNNNYR